MTAFEDEKQKVQIIADSPWSAIKVLLGSAGSFLMPRTAGRSLLALGTVILLRYRRVLTGKIKDKWLEVMGTASFFMHWAIANTVLSAQSAFTDKAKLFFQAARSQPFRGASSVPGSRRASRDR